MKKKWRYWYEEKMTLLHFRTPPPPPPPPLLWWLSWKNAAESFTVALTLTLGGMKVQLSRKNLRKILMEVPVSLMEFLVYSKCKEEQKALVDFFVWSFTFYDAFRGIGLSKLLFLADKIKLEIRICIYESNVFPNVFMTNYVNVFWMFF